MWNRAGLRAIARQGLLALICAGVASSAFADRSYTRLERELAYLMDIWPGDYDNQEQLKFDAEAGKPDMDSGGHLRVHSQVRRVQLPEFGEHVLYVEEYKHDRPDDIFRQRIYVLSADEKAGAIRLELHYFRDRKRWLGAHKDPTILDEIATDATMVLPGCDVLIRREGDWFVGAMGVKTCLFGADDERRYSDYQVRIGPDQYWFRDRILSAATDETLEEMADFSWHQLERARWFACMIDVPPKGSARPTHTAHYVKVHDQGGAFAFVHPDGRDMTLIMRNTWSYEMQRETFFIGVLDGDQSGPTLVYAWGEPGADRIGVNPGFVRVQCDLDTEKNRQLQRALRPDS